MTMEPKTYLEKRCIINENVLDAVLDIMEQTLSPSMLELSATLRDNWDNALSKLDAEMKEEAK